MSGVHTEECCLGEGAKEDVRVQPCLAFTRLTRHGPRPHQNRAGPATCAHVVRSVVPKFAENGGTIGRRLMLLLAIQQAVLALHVTNRVQPLRRAMWFIWVNWQANMVDAARLWDQGAGTAGD